MTIFDPFDHPGRAARATCDRHGPLHGPPVLKLARRSPNWTIWLAGFAGALAGVFGALAVWLIR